MDRSVTARLLAKARSTSGGSSVAGSGSGSAHGRRSLSSGLQVDTRGHHDDAGLGQTQATGTPTLIDGMPSTTTTTTPGRKASISTISTTATSPNVSVTGGGTTLISTLENRLEVWAAVREVHAGRYWLDCVALDDRDFALVDQARLRRRSLAFYALGASAGPLLDLAPSLPFLKSLALLMSEFELLVEDGRKGGKLAKLFRSKSRRSEDSVISPTHLDLLANVSAQHELYTQLVVPHMPFDLDYHQTLQTLSDVFILIYRRLILMQGYLPRIESPWQEYHLVTGDGDGNNDDDEERQVQAMQPSIQSLRIEMDGYVKKIDRAVAKLLQPVLKEVDDLAKGKVALVMESLQRDCLESVI